MNSLTQETEQGNRVSTRTDIFFNRRQMLGRL